MTELYKVSLDIRQGPWGPLWGHERNPVRDLVCLNALAPFQLSLLNAC